MAKLSTKFKVMYLIIRVNCFRTGSGARPLGLKRNLRREEAFKEGRSILGGKSLVWTMRHSGREIFGSDKKISKNFEIFFLKFEIFIFF